MRHGVIKMMVVGLILAMTVSLQAQVPGNMNVQGRLTDGAGDPVAPGLKVFTFKIFDAAVGGSEVWPAAPGEDQTLTTDANGLWSAAIGKFLPLPATVFSDTSRWLEVTVNDGINPPETLSRVKLNTNPYAYVAGSLSGTVAAGLDADYVNVAGDVMTGSLQVPYVDIGHPYSSGTAYLYGATHPQPFIWMYDFYGHGGAVEIWTNDDDQVVQLQPDVDGEGGYFRVNGPASSLQVDGKWGPAPDSNMVVTISGPGGQVHFNTNAKEDAFVVLPDNAVSAPEMLDEPGLSQGIVRNSSVNVTGSTSMMDVVSTSIAIPAAGYIVVEASGMAWLDVSVAGDYNYLLYQIDETAGGSPDANYSQYAGFSQSPNTNAFYIPIYAQRTYLKNASGSYSFRLEAIDGLATASGYRRVWNPTIRATYYPTSYGAVSTVATLEESSQFESAERLEPATATPDGRVAQEPGFVVDLRELELKAARARAEAERLAREVIEAKAAEQERIHQEALQDQR